MRLLRKVNFFRYLYLFYTYTGWRIFLLTGVILISGLMDSFGIILFIPIINTTLSDTPKNDSLGNIIEKVFGFVNLELTFFSVALIIVAIFFAKFVVNFFQALISHYITENLRKEIRMDTLEKYSRLTYGFIINRDIGYLTNVVVNEITKAVLALTTFITVLVSIVYAALYFSIALYIDPLITLGLAAMCLAIYGGIHFANRYSRSLSYELSSVDARLQKMVIQYIEAYKYLKATVSFKRLLPSIGKLTKRDSWLLIQIKVIGATIAYMVEPIAVAIILALLYYRTKIIGVSFAESIILVMFIYKVFRHAMGFQQSWHRFNSQIGGFLTLTELTDEMKNSFEETGDIQVGMVQSGVRYDRVSLKLDGKKILSEVSLDIPRKSTVAFVGRSGAGKTTLVDMLLGLHRPTAGQVLVDDSDLQRIDLDRLRRRIGYVTQEPIIFNDTVLNNVSMWDKRRSMAEIEEKVRLALRLAHCDFVAEEPDALNAVLGDRGIRLSGGQRQRIAIARELYKEPDLLIFDEATSSLDAESEQLIQKSIEELRGKMTMVIIAHRLSSVRNSDTIFVVDSGKIVERGDFQSLYENRSSTFYQLYKTQNV